MIYVYIPQSESDSGHRSTSSLAEEKREIFVLRDDGCARSQRLIPDDSIPCLVEAEIHNVISIVAA